MLRVLPMRGHGIIEAFAHGTIRKPQTTFGNVKADVLARTDPSYRRVDFTEVIPNSDWES
ncbi:hypothetical protein [Inquilinus sp. OTU3971]|uniref:hypothetical protein n=1 Tax=Inquilinus sp. OTU3971 TaxID=3043855 RepID=UPI00313D0102